MNKSRNKWFQAAALAISGLVFALAVTAMLLAGHVNLNRFYDVGEICDVPCETSVTLIDPQITGMTADLSSQFYEVVEPYASRLYFIQQKQNIWNYIYIKISLVDAAELPITFTGYDPSGIERFRTDVILVEGDNYITVGGQAFSQCKIELNDQQGVTFAVQSMKFYEKKIVNWGKKACALTGGIWCLYMFAGILLMRRKSGKCFVRMQKWLDTVINIWQGIFQKAAVEILNWKLPVQSQAGSWLRRILFLMLIWSQYYFYTYELYRKYKNFLYLFAAVLFLIISALTLEKKPGFLRWNCRLVRMWIVFWGCTILSDLIIVKKTGGFLGLLMLFPVSFLFYCWKNMDRPEVLLGELMDSVEISGWIMLVLCLCKFPYAAGVRYTGIFDNPAISSMFIVIPFITYLCRLETEWLRKKIRILRGILYASGGGILLQLIWGGQSVILLGTLGILGFVYLCRLHLLRKLQWKSGRKVMLYTGAMLIMIVCFLASQKWMRREIPSSTIMEEQGEVLSYFQSQDMVYAAETTDSGASRILDKLSNSPSLTVLTSSRNLYWAEYLRSMNLFGNTQEPYFWNYTHLGHNAALTIANRYGCITVILYLLLLFTAICAGSRKAGLKKGGMGLFPVAMICANVLISMGDNVEQPMILLNWLVLYLSIGYLFPGQMNVKKGGEEHAEEC